jgi:exosome complex component RRP4
MTERKIVIPGTIVGKTGKCKPGKGTFKEDDTIYASRLGIVEERASYLNVIPLSGVYEPTVGDNVVGIVEEATKTSWLVDIKAPYPALLRSDEVPWRIDFGETTKYLRVGDAVIVSIAAVNEARNIEISLKGKTSRKIDEGIIIEIQPSKVPRVIGKNGSMVLLLRQHTGCWIFVGQNGRVWVRGKPENISKLVSAIRKIEDEAHTTGLTERISKFLESE